MTHRAKVSDVRINGEALKAIRERSRLTVTELARLTNIDRSNLHRLENGERRGTARQIVDLADALKVPITAITLNGDEDVA